VCSTSVLSIKVAGQRPAGDALSRLYIFRGIAHAVPGGSALAPWAVVATAPGLDDALDASTITPARFTSTAIDEQMILKMALASFTVYII
jgi:hypothetical protein